MAPERLRAGRSSAGGADRGAVTGRTMRMKPNRLLTLVAVLAIAGIPAGGMPVAAQSASPLIRVGAGPDDPSAPLVYAAHEGLFAKAGLNVELERLAGATAVAAAISGGSLEIGKGATLSVVTAIAKGLPFTIIGNMSTYRSTKPDIALIVLKNSPINSAKDLVGKTLAAVSLQDQNSVATFAWLAQQGVDWSTLKYTEIPASAALPAMEQDRIVGSTVYEPVLSADLATNKVKIIGYPYDAIGKRFSDAVLFANPKWIGANRDVVARFLQVVESASSYVKAHESEVAPMSAEFGGVDPAKITAIHHTGRGVKIAPADIQPVIDAALKYKAISKTLDAKDLICDCALRK